jgi:hypothetical protein
MNSVLINTLDFANRLKAAGVPSGQAEAEAQALSDAFEAQSRQLQENIDAKFKQSGALADNALGRLETKMDARFAAVDAKVEKGISEMRELRAEFNGKFTLLQWMLGVIVAGVIVAGVIALVMKSFL